MAFSDLRSDEPLRFSCPRCGADSTDHWYGPCASCRTGLRALLRSVAGDVAVAAYEPKMNVTPNAVAQKE